MKPDITLVFPRSQFLLDEAVFPPLGIMYLAAYLERCGFPTQCLDMGAGDTLEQVNSDVVGVSITTPQRFEAYHIASTLSGKYLIAGGPHATHMSLECRQNGFEYVVCGYGEVELASLLADITGKKVEQLPIGIDDIPFPSRDAMDIHRYHYTIDGKPATPIMTSRGCPFSCGFCGRIGGAFQMQSAERTVAEIEHVHDKYGFEAFMIYDDIFIASKARLKAISDMLGGKYTFRCFARSNLINDDICDSMARLGIVEVGLGVESGSDAVLSKSMKGTTRDQNTHAVKMLHEHGIRAKAFLIVGLPGESDDTVCQTIDWIEEAQPYDIDVSILQPMPGSKIFQDPAAWDISYTYNGKPGWYKGTPGQYECCVSTSALDAESIVIWRDLIEDQYKKKELLR